MASERILAIRKILDDEQALLKYIPVQNIHYTPDPTKKLIYRFAGAVAANLDQSEPAHLPESWLAGNGGYMFRGIARPEWLTEQDYIELRDFPRDVSQAGRNALQNKIFSAAPFMWGHVCVNVQIVLEHGITGIIAILRKRLEDDSLSERQQDFLRCAILEWEAALRYEKRHVDYYLDMAEQACSASEKEKFLEMANRIERVPAHKAESFVDALQSICFMYLCLHCEDVGGHTIGRIDQILYPFYRNDVESGSLTPEIAEEYFFDFWLKFNLSHIILENHSESWALMNTESDLSYNNGLVWTNPSESVTREKHTDDGFVIDIGGLDTCGNDGVNEISWLVLKALDELGTLGLKPVVKYDRKNDPHFLDACISTLYRNRNGLPAITFDRNSRRAFALEPNHRYKPEDLDDIIHIGCVELAIPGRSYTDPMNAFFNLPKILLVAMHDGVLDGVQLGLVLGPAKNFDEFMSHFFSQLSHFIHLYENTVNQAARVFNEKYKRPMVSSLISGCIDKAQLVDEGGAEFWVKSMNCCGLATTVDSLAAIRKVIFEDRQLTMGEFCSILDSDFDGAEPFRQYLIHRIPKFGNGVQSTDHLAKVIVEFYSKEVFGCRTWNDTPFRPGLYSYYGPCVNYGLNTGATPNGRKRGEPVSLNSDPDHGTIQAGLTGTLRSVTSFDHALASNASAVDVHLSNNTPIEVIRDIVHYLDNNGALYMQTTIADREEMLDAQVHPERHRDLVVRVTGFSAHFVALDKATQDEIIARSYWG